MHRMEKTESSFIGNVGSRAQFTHIQTERLKYSDVAKDQIERALARKMPAEKYDFKL
jgi:hypothetical protein